MTSITTLELVACATLALCLGCAETTAQSGVHDPAADGPDAAADGPGAVADAGADARIPETVPPSCDAPPLEETPCDAGVDRGYLAVPTGVAAAPYTCLASELGYCWSSPPPFATLSACLDRCAPDVDRAATQCERPGSGPPLCTPAAGADMALLEARTPFGALHFTHAFLDRVSGFTSSVDLIFTATADARLDALPSARLSLPFFDDQDIVGDHDAFLHVAVCDHTFEVPVRVTVTVDEVVPDLSERFEAAIESLATDIELRASAKFTHVCGHSTSI